MAPFIAMPLAIIAAYLIGSIPASFILAKAVKGVDIRDHGSGNVGATNVLRVAGKVPAVIALILDILKGVISVTVIAGYSYQFLPDVEYDFYRPLLGFVTICGHVWPVFLNFKGGKGVATTLGVVAVIAPLPFLLSGLVWLAVFVLTSYVSLASIVLDIFLPVFAVLLNESIYTVLFFILIAALSIYKHSGNIKRLVRGQESKTLLSRSKK
ncbi:MAG: glycerol-3-phosphate 1-O-acyltransferase PlsY [Candidatus Omnitrophota bacterium]